MERHEFVAEEGEIKGTGRLHILMTQHSRAIEHKVKDSA
jgi:hypothetical protein